MKYLCLIILLLMAVVNCHSQHSIGVVKEKLQFLNSKGKVIRKSKLQAWYTYYPELNSKEAIRKDLEWSDDTTVVIEMFYLLNRTARAGKIFVVHKNKDTMVIDGLSSDFDKVPFRKGNYLIPHQFDPFLQATWSGVNKPVEIDWHNFEVGQQKPLPIAYLEYVPGKELPTENDKCTQFGKEESRVIYWQKSEKKKIPIVDNRNGYNTLVCNDELVVLQCRHEGVFYARAPFTQWKLGVFKDKSNIVVPKGLTIDQMWLEGQNLYIKATSWYRYQSTSSLKSKNRTYRVHFGLEDNSDEVRSFALKSDLEKKEQVEMLIKSLIDIRKDRQSKYFQTKCPERITDMLESQSYRKKYHSPGSPANLKLENGHFEFQEKFRTIRDIQEYTTYVSSGTYTVTDSTITFVEKQRELAEEIAAQYHSFTPTGTYHWYTEDGILHLTRFEPDWPKLTYYDISYSYYVKKD